MTPSAPKSFLFLLAALAVAVQLAWFDDSFDRPWYYNFDLDEFVNTDNLLMGQGHFPDHLVPPGLGMHAAFAVSTRLAKALGALDVGRLDDVTRASFPLYAVAEHVRFLRGHSPWLVAVTALALMSGLTGLAPLSLAVAASLAGLILFLPSWGYQASIIRPEMFALAFYALALTLLAAAAKSRAPGSRLGLALLAGIFVGLTIFTKVQALFFVAMAYVLAVLWRSLARGTDAGDESAPPARLLAGLAALQAAAWGVLAWLAWNTPLYETAVTLTTRKGLTKPGLVILALSAATLAWALAAALFPRRFGPKSLAGLAGPESLTLAVGLSTGLPLAFLASLAAFPEPARALRFTLSTISTVFFNQSQFYYLFVFNWPEKFAAHAPTLVAVTLCPLAVAWAARSGRIAPGRAASLCLVLLTLLFYAVVFFGSRTLQGEVIVKDFLWVETAALLVVASSLALLHGPGSTTSSRRLGTALAVGCLALGLTGAAYMPKRQLAELSWYGYRGRPFTQTILEGNGLIYQSLLQERLRRAGLTESLAAASFGRVAVDLWRMTLPGAAVDSRGVSPLLPGLAPLRDCPGLALEAVPDELAGATLFDAASRLMGQTPPAPASPVRAGVSGLRLFAALPVESPTPAALGGLAQAVGPLVFRGESLTRAYALYDISGFQALPAEPLPEAFYVLAPGAGTNDPAGPEIPNLSGRLP